MPRFARLVDHRDPGSAAAGMRRRRFQRFIELTNGLHRPVQVLDVGGEQRFWEVMGVTLSADFQVTLYNISRVPVTLPNFNAIQGDAADLSRFGDASYDIVFSNSVIEHLGSFERQAQMAREVQRVGRRYYVQTPNRYFPLEPHFLFPFFQFLPLKLQTALIQRFNLGWYRRVPDRMEAEALVRSHRLLNVAELHRLFPSGRIYRERLLGITKSFVVYGTH